MTNGRFASDPSFGCNGAFLFDIKGELVLAIASDELGWEHVSVSFVKGCAKRTLSWRQMCAVKDMFWDAEDAVIQIHPPESEYVSQHPGCLHLWRPTDQSMPLPPSVFVGNVKKKDRDVG